MKNMTGSLLFCVVVFTTSLTYGGQPPTDGGPKPVGVSGVKVVVKGKPSNQTLTDRDGKFTLEALPAGSYTLSFRARRITDLPSWHRFTRDEVIVATSYSINLEGAQSLDPYIIAGGRVKPVNLEHLNTSKLLDGVEIRVKVGAGAQLRGQVLGGDPKKWVWSPKRVDSNIPGRWVPADSQEANKHDIIAHAPKNWIFK